MDTWNIVVGEIYYFLRLLQRYGYLDSTEDIAKSVFRNSPLLRTVTAIHHKTVSFSPLTTPRGRAIMVGRRISFGRPSLVPELTTHQGKVTGIKLARIEGMKSNELWREVPKRRSYHIETT
jgi:hypothetical protein